MTKQYLIIVFCIMAIALFVAGCDALVSQGIMGAGVTNFTNLELAGTLDVAGNTDGVGTLNYGTNSLYPIGYTSAGQQLVYGTESITGTVEVTTGLTTVTWALCTIGEDPASGAADHLANCTVAISSNTVEVQVCENDQITESTEVGVVAHWLAVGTP